MPDRAELAKFCQTFEESSKREKEREKGIRASSKFDHNLIRKSVKTSSTKARTRQREKERVGSGKKDLNCTLLQRAIYACICRNGLIFGCYFLGII